MSVLTTEEYRIALLKTNFLLEHSSTTSKIRRKLKQIKTLLRVAAGAVAQSTMIALNKIISTLPEEAKEELAQSITEHQERISVANVGFGTKLLALKGRDLGYMTDEFVALIYEQLLSIDSYQPSEQMVEVINALHSGAVVDSDLIRHFVLSYYRKVIDVLLPVIGKTETDKLHERVTLAENGVFELLNEFVDGLEIDQTTERSLNKLRIVGGRHKTKRRRKTKRKKSFRLKRQ